MRAAGWEAPTRDVGAAGWEVPTKDVRIASVFVGLAVVVWRGHIGQGSSR
jgi:hypothetical protein